MITWWHKQRNKEQDARLRQAPGTFPNSMRLPTHSAREHHRERRHHRIGIVEGTHGSRDLGNPGHIAPNSSTKKIANTEASARTAATTTRPQWICEWRSWCFPVHIGFRTPVSTQNAQLDTHSGARAMSRAAPCQARLSPLSAETSLHTCVGVAPTILKLIAKRDRPPISKRQRCVRRASPAHGRSGTSA